MPLFNFFLTSKLSTRSLSIRGQKGQVHGGLCSFFWAFGGSGSRHVSSHPPWAAGTQEDLVPSSLLSFLAWILDRTVTPIFITPYAVSGQPSFLCNPFYVSPTNLFMSPTGSSSVTVSLLNFCCSLGLQFSRALKPHLLDTFSTLPKAQHKPLPRKVSTSRMNTQFSGMLDHKFPLEITSFL